MKDPAGTLIMELHMGENDDSPMQFISAARLAHFQSLEMEVHKLRLTVGWLRLHAAAPDAPVPQILD